MEEEEEARQGQVAVPRSNYSIYVLQCRCSDLKYHPLQR